MKRRDLEKRLRHAGCYLSAKAVHTLCGSIPGRVWWRQFPGTPKSKSLLLGRSSDRLELADEAPPAAGECHPLRRVSTGKKVSVPNFSFIGLDAAAEAALDRR